MAKKAKKAEKAENWWESKKGRIQRVRDCYKKAYEADRENREGFEEDMKFVHEPGAQWDDFMKQKRMRNGKEIRPMLQFNRTRTTVKRIVNSMRANPTQGKVRPVEDSDKDTADVMEGLIRNIANQSNFDAIRDNAAEYQVAGGYAAWRITTDYSDPTAFDQDIKIEGLKNPLCLYCDPNAYDLCGRDATWWLLTDKISKEAYESKYDAEPVDFETNDDDDDWEDDDGVRIAEFWYQVPVTKTIHLLDDGKTIDDEELQEALQMGRQVLKSRPVKCYDIYSAIYSGDAELTEPAKWAGMYFPWVRTYGEYLFLDGKIKWFGLPRHVRDAQKAFNLGQTSVVEGFASSPINQTWATAKQAEGLASSWTDAVDKNLPFQVYNFDPQSPGPPVRVGGPPVPAAAIQLAQVFGEEIKANSGIFDASLGAQGNETSGRAINARQAQGEIATFNYPANMANAERRTWEILVDLVPRVYDTERSLRILGPDDSEKYIKINQPGPNGEVLNDLSRGKYDVMVTVGPSFSTKRQEAVEAYSSMAQGNPQLMMAAGDLIMKGMDLPYADEVSERLKMMLPPQIQQAINKDTEMPPEVQQAMMQVDQAMQQVQQQGQMVQQAAAEAQQEKAGAEKAKADVQIAIANLKTEEANLATKQAQFEKLVADAKAEIAQLQMQADSQANEGQQAKAEGEMAVSAAIQQIQQAAMEFKAEAQDFLTQAAQVVAASTQTPMVIEKSGPRTVRVKRVNGELMGEIMDGDGNVRQVRTSRDAEGLTGVME